MFSTRVSTFLCILTSFVAQATDCPDLWIPFAGSCYRFGHQAMTFSDAEHYCQQHGGHLVHIGGKAENDFVKQEINELRIDHFWIGLTDIDVEGRWVWQGTDEAAQYFDWNPGQPDSYGTLEEDCGEIVRGSGNMVRWNDVGCNVTRTPLCETIGDDVNTIVC